MPSEVRHPEVANGHSFGPDLLCSNCDLPHALRDTTQCPGKTTKAESALGPQNKDTKGVMQGETA